MSAVITTGTHPKALWPGIHEWWGLKYNEHPEECVDLFTRASSSQSYEEDVEATGFGLAPVKGEGTSTVYDSETQGVTKRYTHVAYGLGYVVTYEELRDNLYEKLSKRRAGALAFSFRQTKENVGANVYNRAFNSNFVGGDGKEMIATDHPTLSGDQSNRLTVNADLSESSIEDLQIQIMQAKNNRGLKISLIPQSLHVHPSDWFEANRILKSVLQNDTANNAINVLKATNALPKGIKVNHYFTDSDAWFMRTNCPNGAMNFTREAISFEKDNDFDTKNAKAASYERYSFGWTDFRDVWGSAGA
jgi:hypothetical protein|tara:strand:- start:9121 stop:10032 length:912 start_codon:yes stop_codon:yes gene_type:complete